MPFFVLEMNKNRVLPQKIWKRASYFQLFKISWLIQKKNEWNILFTRTCEFVKKKTFVQQFSIALSKGNFTHALCRRTEVLHSLSRVDKRVSLRNRLARCW